MHRVRGFFLRCGLVAAALLLAAPVVRAVTVHSLYVVLVPAAEPAQAAQAAMRIELVRLTGTGSAASDPELDPLIQMAQQYVQSQRPTTSGQVQVLFDEQALSAAIQGTGHTLWGADRPLVWIQLPAEDDATDASMRMRLAGAADARGLPINIVNAGAAAAAAASTPAASAPAPAANAPAGAASVPGASDPRVWLGIAQRAGANAALVAQTDPSEPGMLQWTLVSPDVTAHWVGGPELAVDNAADALAGVARTLEQAPAAQFACRIDDVDDLNALVTVLDAIRATPGVISVAVEQVSGAALTLQLTARGGEPQLAHALAGERLQAVGAAPAPTPAVMAGAPSQSPAVASAALPAGTPLEFRYVPGP